MRYLNTMRDVIEDFIMRHGATVQGRPLFVRAVSCTLVDREKHKINPLIEVL
jgi:hypothetical protein